MSHLSHSLKIVDASLGHGFLYQWSDPPLFLSHIALAPWQKYLGTALDHRGDGGHHRSNFIESNGSPACVAVVARRQRGQSPDRWNISTALGVALIEPSVSLGCCAAAGTSRARRTAIAMEVSDDPSLTKGYRLEVANMAQWNGIDDRLQLEHLIEVTIKYTPIP